jgi:hypothetical protein
MEMYRRGMSSESHTTFWQLVRYRVQRTLEKIAPFVCGWARKRALIERCVEQLDMNHIATADWYNYMRDVCFWKPHQVTFVIGEPGMTFKIEECSWMRTNHAIRIFPQQGMLDWVCFVTNYSSSKCLTEELKLFCLLSKSGHTTTDRRPGNRWPIYRPCTKCGVLGNESTRKWVTQVRTWRSILGASYWAIPMTLVTSQAIDITVFFSPEVVMQLIIDAVLLSVKCQLFNHFCLFIS